MAIRPSHKLEENGSKILKFEMLYSYENFQAYLGGYA